MTPGQHAMTLHTGIGLRQPHYDALLAAAPPLAFVEVHSENFFADGGAALAVLDAARSHWPVSLHGVGLALGSAAGVDDVHLRRLAALVRRIEPVRVSDHASFARAPRSAGGAVVVSSDRCAVVPGSDRCAVVPGSDRCAVVPGSDRCAVVHGNDLLPPALTAASLDITVANVQRVQERLGRALLVENISAYLQWADAEMDEPTFFNALAQRSGCGLLLDVNNLVVNALNALQPGQDESEAVQAACRWVDQIDAARVGEIHLAGYDATTDIVIDDHGSRVHAPVWQVFAHTVRRLGPRPTLIEWDTALPPLAVLLGEAALAEGHFR